MKVTITEKPPVTAAELRERLHQARELLRPLGMHINLTVIEEDRDDLLEALGGEVRKVESLLVVEDLAPFPGVNLCVVSSHSKARAARDTLIGRKEVPGVDA